MKQLYYTSCEAGKSVGGQSGFKVRAVSAGVSPDLQRAVCSQVGYELPNGVPDNVEPAQAPVRLALLDVSGAGRLLIHAVYVGHDPVTDRFGNFFSHALLEVPPSVDARAAALTWGSGFWQRRHEGGTDLPTVDALAPGNSAALDRQLASLLADPAGRELFAFALQAILETSAAQRLYLVARPEQIAVCVYGLTRALPKAQRETLTFSTYEKIPLQSEARVVGAWWPAGTTADLPSTCYDGRSHAFNTLSGRKSTLASPSEYVAFAVDRLARNSTELSSFMTWCDSLGLTDARQVDEAFRLRFDRPVTRDELLRALENRGLAPAVLARKELPAQVVGWALDDATFRGRDFGRFVAILRGTPPGAAALVTAATDATRAAIINQKDLERTRTALETVLPAVAAPERVKEFWEAIAAQLDPAPLPWELRLYLSQKLLTQPVPKSGPGTLGRWAAVPVKQLGALLETAIHLDWKVQAFLRCHAGANALPAPEVIQVLGRDPTLLFRLLEESTPRSGNSPDAEADNRAANLFVAAAREARGRERVAELLSNSQRFSPALCDRCVVAALKAGLTTTEHLFTTYGEKLFQLLPTGAVIAEVAEGLLARSGDASSSDARALPFLRKCQQSNVLGRLSPTAQQRLATRIGLSEFRRAPSLDRTILSQVRDMLAKLPAASPERKRENQEVVKVVAGRLLVESVHGVRERLADILELLGPVVAANPKELYGNLIATLEGHKQFLKNPDLLHAFIATGFGEPMLRRPADKFKELKATSDLVRRVRDLSPAVFTVVEKKVAGWASEGAREYWDAAVGDNTPARRTFWERFRDPYPILLVFMLMALVIMVIALFRDFLLGLIRR